MMHTIRTTLPGSRHRLKVTLASALTLLCTAFFLPSAHADDASELTARGAYLAHAADCAACHTAQKPGAAAFAGDYPIPSPMGPIYSTNITPSKQYGIGTWTEQQFARAVREGVKPDGTHLYPAMPYDAYSGISDADIHALYSYFTTQVKPVDTAPENKTALSFPFDQRWTMSFWNLFFLDDSRFKPRAGESAEIARGRYLVDNLAHCSTCHTPRNTLMATDNKAYLSGAMIEGWMAPNITSDPVSGIGGWTDEELTQFMRFGHVKDKAVAAGGMGEAVQRSLRNLSDADLQAIAHYLKTVPARQTSGQQQAAYQFGETPSSHYTFNDKGAKQTDNDLLRAQAAEPDAIANAADARGIHNGAILYSAACASCHQANGGGTADNYYPSLMHSTAVGAPYANNLIMTILDGVDRNGADKHYKMPGYRNDLDDEQIAAVSNYVLQRFGNPAVKVTEEQVATLRHGGPKPFIARVSPWIIMVPVAVIVVVILLLLAFVFRRRAKK